MNPQKWGCSCLWGKNSFSLWHHLDSLRPLPGPLSPPPLPSFPTTDATKECVARRQCGSICLFFLNSSGQVKSFHLSSVYLFYSLPDLSAKANPPSFSGLLRPTSHYSMLFSGNETKNEGMLSYHVWKARISIDNGIVL